MVKVYVGASYCPDCEEYFMPRAACSICGGVGVPKCVLKGSDDDPRMYVEQSNIAFKENVRVSHSMGVPVAQFEQARKAHPGVEWKKVGTSMCPVIRRRNDKLRVMKSFGMEEYPPNLFGQRNEKSRWENRKGDRKC